MVRLRTGRPSARPIDQRHRAATEPPAVASVVEGAPDPRGGEATERALCRHSGHLVDFVLNQVIVKTLTAAATVVADSIDNLNISGMAASIAGDNVVLIITKGEIEAKNVANQLNDYIK